MIRTYLKGKLLIQFHSVFAFSPYFWDVFMWWDLLIIRMELSFSHQLQRILNQVCQMEAQEMV